MLFKRAFGDCEGTPERRIDILVPSGSCFSQGTNNAIANLGELPKTSHHEILFKEPLSGLSVLGRVVGINGIVEMKARFPLSPLHVLQC